MHEQLPADDLSSQLSQSSSQLIGLPSPPPPVPLLACNTIRSPVPFVLAKATASRQAHLGNGPAGKPDDEDVGPPSDGLEALLEVLPPHQVHHHIHPLGGHRLSPSAVLRQ